MGSTPNDLTTEDPDDYIFVSNKNYYRKQQVQNGNGNILQQAIGRPGPITGIVLSAIDAITGLIIRLSILLLQISSLAFDFTYNLIFGNFNGIIPSSLKKGKVVSMKWFRYTMTILMPPFGVFLNKGIYGWFNILVCIILTYIHYLLGIVYAIVITVRNRYADQYEDKQMKIALANNPPEQVKADINALVGSLVFVIILFGTIGFMLHQF
jgi:uncharacterized membrane protein YqaE (UPF0057 family)